MILYQMHAIENTFAFGVDNDDEKADNIFIMQ